MLENDLSQRPERHPVANLIIILGLVGLGFVFVGPVVGYFAAMPFYNGSGEELFAAIQDPINHPEVKVPIYIIQGFATLIGLIVVPALFMARSGRAVAEFFRNQKTEWVPILITVFVVVIFMAVNSVFVEWNSNFKFPDFELARKFEAWAREKEDTAAELTEFLTRFKSQGELLIAIIVIAVLPAIGEEIVFRGLIQNELHRATKNVHASVWIAAVLFSAIHLQFFGFVPRVLLGALFGYLYYWSGNLTLAILAHFVNNGVSVMAMYFYQQGAFEYDMESTESAPITVVIICTLMTAALLFYFHRYFQHRKPSIS
ncbi:CPBP family intramembrane metalloprotease [Fulvivirgaceae bacterium PWU4]|uniref:CPBP family intramembrane metalloprotease n=1 Tax=Chryseosolibacter histidini TaxID=2782349 RepID=A0AAP2DRK1_9BACT|nr:CPBP family intramembrane glutamic endopeptidase [Chryseosolibacter histidini]MBT1701195.1 CPBP family intramembrane metalloprotease [Chryseosolibacter histidini]